MAQWIAILAGVGCLVAAMTQNSPLIIFVDKASMFFVFVTGFFIAFAAHGVRPVFRALMSGLSPVPAVDEDAARDALILRTLRNTVCAAGVLGFLVGFVQMMTFMSDPKTLGPAMAICILTGLYAIFAELFLSPMINRLHARAGGSPWTAPSHGYRGTVILVLAIVAHLASFLFLLNSIGPALK
jgi:type III secretory pathway component EscS